MITREEISKAINKGWVNYGEFTTDTAIDKVIELLESKGVIHKSDVIDIVSGRCECGKHKECCINTRSDLHNKVYLDFRCGKVQNKTIECIGKNCH